MIVYQVWVDDRLEDTLKGVDLGDIKSLCAETWTKYCKEPYPARIPEIWWTPADNDGFITGFFYWWPHKPFRTQEQRDLFLMTEHSKGHYIKFDILPLDLG